MCGISGVSLPKGQQAKPAHLQPLGAALAHRGPDGEGIWYSGTLGLAHRRLSIIDVGGGRQPLVSQLQAHQNAAVVNGEIYNYKALQTQVQAAGFTLKTASDSEPPLHLYALHGEAMPETLEGMYALAVADGAAETLLLAVDPFGIKPLYYCQTNVGFAFASEPRALAAAGWVRREPNVAVLPMLLNRHYSVGAATLWQGIQRLVPGERLLVKHGVVVKRWRVFPPLHAAHAGAEASQFPAQLEAAVARHLQADVPYGLLLSGGLDSTALAVMMRRLGAPVHAFTARIMVKNGPNEADIAAAVCQKLGAQHTVVEYGAADFWSGLVQLANAMDDLATDYAALPLLKLTATARKHVKILLSGEGGDETLAGYSAYRKHPSWLKALLARWKANRVGDAAPYAALFRTAVTTPPFPPEGWDKDAFTPLQRRQSTDIANWLPADLLLKLDRTTMHNGIEGRVPYLDSHLAAFSFALPDAAKVNETFGKLPLRQFLAAEGFPELAWARKQGFSVAVGEFLGQNPQALARLWGQSPLLGTLLKPEAAPTLLGQLKHPKAANLAFSLTVLALWEAIHVRQVAPAELRAALTSHA